MNAFISRRSLLAATSALASGLTLRPAFAQSAQPPAGFSFLALGDWGSRGIAPQRAVAAAMAQAAKQAQARFIVALGDNFYPSGVSSIVDPHWQESFEQVYTAPSLQVPWYPVLGNHDHNGAPMAQVAYSQLSDRWTMPGPYYLRREKLGDGSTVEFFFLDTMRIVQAHEGLGGFIPNDIADDQLAWLEHALGASKARWKIVVGHHPVLSGGPHGNTPELLRIVKPMLDRHRVTAYICGHDHNMQHIVRDGIHYVLCGAGSSLRPPKSMDGTVFMAGGVFGFLRVGVSPHGIEIAFINNEGTILHNAAVSAIS